MADRRKKAWFGALTAAALATAASAQAAGTEGANFLNIPVGGRPAALGGAYSALAEDAYAPVWNPAGLSFLRSPQVAGMHLDYGNSIGYEFLSGALPLGAHGGLGGAIQLLHPKNARARDSTGTDIGTFSSHFAAYSAGYGHSFNQSFALGGAFKVVEARIGNVSGTGVAGDVGGLYRPSPRVSIAAVAANLGAKIKFLQVSDTMPSTYRLGLQVSPTSKVSLAAETAYDQADSVFARFGAEWRPVSLLALRAGYHSDSRQDIPGLTGLTTGVGLTAYGQRFDYAWAPMGALGNTQYFSVLFQFGSGDKK